MSNLKTVLLVDDDPDDTFFMQQAFDKAGYAGMLRAVSGVKEAIDYIRSSGTDGRKKARAPLPDLVLLDIHLRGTAGFHLLEWLRSKPAHKHLPVVMLTGSISYQDIKLALDAGANSYMVKPPTLAKRREMVKTLVAYWNLSATP